MDAAQQRQKKFPLQRLIFIAGPRGHKTYAIFCETRWATEYYELSAKRPLARWIKLSRALLSLARTDRPTLVIVDMLGPRAFLIYCVARCRGAKFASRLRGDPWLKTEDALSDQTGWQRLFTAAQFRLETFLLRRSDFWLPVCSYLAEVASAKLCTQRPVVVVPTCVGHTVPGKLPEKCPRFPAGIVPGDDVILSVTNFEYRDKSSALLRFAPVFNDILHERGTLHWVILGGGRLQEKVKAAVHAVVTSPHRVHFVGHQSNVNPWYRRCRFLLHLSFFDGLPNVILEAALNGKCTLANPFGGIPEQIVHGQTGLLVDADDQGAMAGAALQLLSQPGLAGLLGRKAQERVLGEYSARAIGTKFEQDLLGAL